MMFNYMTMRLKNLDNNDKLDRIECDRWKIWINFSILLHVCWKWGQWLQQFDWGPWSNDCEQIKKYGCP